MERTDDDGPPARRATNQRVADLRKIRQVTEDIVDEVGRLHERVVIVVARARHMRDRERADVAAECDAISSATAKLRVELIRRFVDQPTNVVGHSRVLDLEKAIDSLEQNLKEARSALSAAP